LNCTFSIHLEKYAKKHRYYVDYVREDHSVAIASHTEIWKIMPYPWTQERSPCPRCRCDQFARICWCARYRGRICGVADGAWPPAEDHNRGETAIRYDRAFFRSGL